MHTWARRVRQTRLLTRAPVCTSHHRFFTSLPEPAVPRSSSTGSPVSSSSSSSKTVALFVGGFVICLSGTAGAVIYQQRKLRAEAAAVAALPLYEGNPVVYLDIADNDVHVGRLVFQLRRDCVPRAAENFRQLCAGTPGWGYRATALHGIEKQSRVFGGDFFGSGSGGHSIYGETFDDENLSALSHAGPGMLAMRNFGPNTNNSQFYVTLRALPQLDGVHEVIGSLLEGFEVLQRLDDCAMPSTPTFHAKHDFRISACGELGDYAGRPRVPLPQPPTADVTASSAALRPRTAAETS
jgi:cyclophilin family peptidyl-prolyl cis-trans isomerase